MKKAEDIVLKYNGTSDGWETTYTYEECIQMVNEARKEAIEECAALFSEDQPAAYLDKQAILSLTKKLQ